MVRHDRDDGRTENPEGTMRDINGNTVGSWHFEAVDEAGSK
jgi:hypothetical protein